MFKTQSASFEIFRIHRLFNMSYMLGFNCGYNIFGFHLIFMANSIARKPAQAIHSRFTTFLKK